MNVIFGHMEWLFCPSTMSALSFGVAAESVAMLSRQRARERRRARIRSNIQLIDLSQEGNGGEFVNLWVVSLVCVYCNR